MTTVGIIGGGQLGRMLCLAAAPLGIDTHVFAPEPDAPAFAVATRQTVAAYDDPLALEAFSRSVSVITFEFENVPFAPLRGVATPTRPSLKALAIAQDRIEEKAFFASCGLPVVRHRPVASADELREALHEIGTPAILKTRRFGYDGKGQHRIAAGDDPGAAFAAIGSAPAVLEEVVRFRAETSTVLVRAMDGTCAAYDAPDNRHEGGILRTSKVPGPLDPATERRARDLIRALAERLEYVGVLAVEWFVTDDPERPLIANEMAPRVHNSGHWTLDGARTSQFENHVRAVAGLPLGSVERVADVEMVNLIGEDVASAAQHLDTANAKLHLYGKREVRLGRKMGHVNLVASRHTGCGSFGSGMDS